MYVLVIHILSYDIWFYITHLLLHHRYLYFIHKIHHSTNYKTITYKDAHNSHILENIIEHIGLIIPYVIGIHPNYIILLIAIIIINVRGMMRHDDSYSWLIGNHHLLHHKNQRYNFGEYWIDKLCGTCYPYHNEYIYGLIYT
jgi:Delta7-sterol 5-desaturase